MVHIDTISLQMMVKAQAYILYKISLKNLLMERFIQQIKDKIECFDNDHFSCNKEEECDRKHVRNWLMKMFILYLSMRADKIIVFIQCKKL